MRHRKHRQQLGVKREHRAALIATLAASLFRYGRIQTTLVKAKALRPFAEKVITYAKKAELSEDNIKKVHYRRLAVARVRDEDAVKTLFITHAKEFLKRPGGYTRIYKLGARIGDAAETALIELVKADDPGYKKAPKKAVKKAKAKKGAKDKTASAEKTEAAAEKPAAAPKAEKPAAEPVAEKPKAAEKPAAAPAPAAEKPVAPAKPPKAAAPVAETVAAEKEVAPASAKEAAETAATVSA